MFYVSVASHATAFSPSLPLLFFTFGPIPSPESSWLGTQLTPFSAEVLAFLREHPLVTAAVLGLLAVTVFVVSALQAIRSARAVREEEPSEDDNQT